MNYVIASALAELAITLDEQPIHSSPPPPYILNVIIQRALVANPSSSGRRHPPLHQDQDHSH